MISMIWHSPFLTRVQHSKEDKKHVYHRLKKYT